MTKTAKGGWIAAALATTVIATPGLAAGDFHRHNPYCGHGAPRARMEHRDVRYQHRYTPVPDRREMRERPARFSYGGRGRGPSFRELLRYHRRVRPPRMITLCWNQDRHPVTLTVPKPAAFFLLKAGGTLGPCDVSPHR